MGMTRNAALPGAIALALLLEGSGGLGASAQGPTPVAAAAQVERGKAVYKEQNCDACHAIGGVGNRKSPLDRVGATLTEETIRKWIVSPRELNPTVRKKGFSLSKSDLDALVAYLRTLRAPAGR